MYGSLTFTAKMGANHLKAGQEGNQYIEFPDNKQKIVITLPKYTLGGTVMGDRTINIDHYFSYTDVTNGYKCILIFNPILKSGGMFSSHTYPDKSDEFRGVIYLKNNIDTTGINYKKLSDIVDMKKKLCDIEGSWIKELKIDGKRYWHVDDEDCRPFR